MPTPDNAKLIEGQRQDWNRVAGGWEKWDRLFDEQMAFFNHRLVADARLHAGMRVLDLGSGTGYPALLRRANRRNDRRVSSAWTSRNRCWPPRIEKPNASA